MGLLDGTTQQHYYENNNHGNYQFTSLDDIIQQFMFIYVGKDKLISSAKRSDVVFFAQRAMQELSFDTFKSIKSQEIEVPATLQMILPQDYVNYTKISWVDSAGIKHLLYPTSKTSNPINPLQNSSGEFKLTAVGDLDGSSANIVLDGEYKNIQVGMIVSSAPYIRTLPQLATVLATSNLGGITTITIGYIDSATGTQVLVAPAIATPVTSISGVTLTFENPDESLVLEKESSEVVENLSWNVLDHKITGTASELTGVKVGMLVSHDYFPIGTTVTNVYSTIVVTSMQATTPVTSGGEVTFIYPDPKDSDTLSNYKSRTPSENQDDYQDNTYWSMAGERYGLDPQHAQANGSFYIDQTIGKIHFSSNISGRTIVLDYISDGLGTDVEMQVHKFAEEAMYKWILYNILSTRYNTPEYIINRYKKEKIAETRKAKLRLSNIKLEEITQILRGKSKQIKH